MEEPTSFYILIVCCLQGRQLVRMFLKSRVTRKQVQGKFPVRPGLNRLYESGSMLPFAHAGTPNFTPAGSTCNGKA